MSLEARAANDRPHGGSAGHAPIRGCHGPALGLRIRRIPRLPHPSTRSCSPTRPAHSHGRERSARPAEAFSEGVAGLGRQHAGPSGGRAGPVTGSCRQLLLDPGDALDEHTEALAYLVAQVIDAPAESDHRVFQTTEAL